MKEHAQAMVKASFAADSLALGVHWMYDAVKLKLDHGEVNQLLPPPLDSYHPTKQKGDFTHYGDQSMVLLTSVAESGGFDLHDFFTRWKALFKAYDGYHDSATKLTLQNIGQGKGPDECGSPSQDMSAAGRIAPLILRLHNDEPQLLKAVKAQTGMTHQSTATVESAEFFTRVCLQSLQGVAPSQAIQDIAQNYFSESPIAGWSQKGLAAVNEDSVTAIIKFGQACSTQDAFSGIVQIIAKYEDEPSQGVIQAVMAGGDNAARAAIVAMTLTAYKGLDKTMEGWYQSLNQTDTISRYLEQIQI